jgi:hypothetical protein
MHNLYIVAQTLAYFCNFNQTAQSKQSPNLVTLYSHLSVGFRGLVFLSAEVGGRSVLDGVT